MLILSFAVFLKHFYVQIIIIILAKWLYLCLNPIEYIPLYYILRKYRVGVALSGVFALLYPIFFAHFESLVCPGFEPTIQQLLLTSLTRSHIWAYCNSTARPQVTLGVAKQLQTLMRTHSQRSAAASQTSRSRTSSNSSLPYAWITGPATDPSSKYLFWLEIVGHLEIFL